MTNTVSETALMNSNVFRNLYSLPYERNLDKHKGLVVINGPYRV